MTLRDRRAIVAELEEEGPKNSRGHRTSLPAKASAVSGTSEPSADEEDYQDSSKFDPQLTCEGAGFTNLGNDIASAIGVSSDSDRRQLSVLLANLLGVYRRHPKRWLAVSRNKNSYAPQCLPRRYNRRGISYGTVKLCDRLRDHGLVTIQPGFFDRAKGKGFVSRVRATDTLGSKFEALPVTEATGKHSSAESVVLRDADKALIDYKETARTQRVRRDLDRINHQIASTPIELNSTTLQPGKLCRIFNNGRWDHGGRFYGGTYQSLRKPIRKQIRINGAPTVERDFSAMHVRILYKREAGIDYVGDPYVVSGYESPEARGVLKKILLTCLNAKDREAAIRAVWNDRRDHPEEYPDGLNIREAVDAFVAAHPSIEKYFFQPDLGVRLQYIDSEVAKRALLDLAEQGITALPIHDSFIVAANHEDFLKEAMRSAYRAVVESEPVIHHLLGFLARSQSS